MHGVKRTRDSAAVLAARREKEAAILKDYLELETEVLRRNRAREFTQDSFDLTTKLLKSSFEHYTTWNLRRRVLESTLFPDALPAQINELIGNELLFTSTALRQHPKVYWIWNHRRWCLERIPDCTDGDQPAIWKEAAWKKELFVVEKMLDSDARNFHAWNYRRYVLASLPTPRPPSEELAYTRRKIEANHSNFSAWHQRSKVFTTIWQGKGPDEIFKVKAAEFDLVKTALFMNPDDQSGWLYHRWLIGSRPEQEVLLREIQVVNELLELEPDSKWCLESLLHYKRLSLQTNLASNVTVVKQECLDLLGRLEQVDAAHVARYRQLKAQLTHP
ncbi:hypothetical protein BKA62DRAFT_684222 [Auriculariales sp. MPI-PUGE-AT-0066]|nr:hypothetical protein BKA62DRAFT_684222 [Auriculariales sp. MPI-PUGE-AT-0066]